MKPYYKPSLWLKVCSFAITLSLIFYSCQQDVDAFLEEENSRFSASNIDNNIQESLELSSNEPISTENFQTNTGSNNGSTDFIQIGTNCSGLDFVSQPYIDPTKVYHKFEKINLRVNQRFRNGYFNIHVKKYRSMNGSDMIELIRYEGRPAIKFRVDEAGGYANYFGYSTISMPNLSEHYIPDIINNNRFLAPGTYNIIKEVKLNDFEILIVFDANTYSTGVFNNQISWGFLFVADKLETTFQYSGGLYYGVENPAFIDVLVDNQIYRPEIKEMSITFEAECGTNVTKYYDSNLNPM